MKGIVFTEFLEMVEDTFSPDLADRIVEKSELAPGGIYTTVGTYDHREMTKLVSCLSKETGFNTADLMRAFGEHLFKRFFTLYPKYFEGIESAFGFLANVEDYIHVEVLKLYPEAELPSFRCDLSQPGCLQLTYQSSRPFASLADAHVLMTCPPIFCRVSCVTTAGRPPVLPWPRARAIPAPSSVRSRTQLLRQGCRTRVSRSEW